MSVASPGRDSAFAVILRHACVLLVRARRKKHWQLPGGRLESAESARAAARREVDEETGLDAVIGAVTGVYGRSDGSLAIVFSARISATAEVAGPRHEILLQRWVPRREALRLLPSRVRRRLADALETLTRSGAPERPVRHRSPLTMRA